jgi:hypothetical protein
MRWHEQAGCADLGYDQDGSKRKASDYHPAKVLRPRARALVVHLASHHTQNVSHSGRLAVLRTAGDMKRVSAHDCQ